MYRITVNQQALQALQHHPILSIALLIASVTAVRLIIRIITNAGRPATTPPKRTRPTETLPGQTALHALEKMTRK